MYGRFDYYGVPDIDREMREASLTEAKWKQPKGIPPVGTRVRFEPNPASLMLYSGRMPARGEDGTVTTVPLGGRSSHFMPGPGGGLVYVKWDKAGTVGAAPQDIVKVSGGKKESLGEAQGRKARKWIHLKPGMFTKGEGKKSQAEERFEAIIDAKLEALGLGRGKRRRPGGRGLRTAKPAGGRGLGPGGGKGPFRGTGLGPGTGECETEVEWLEATSSPFPEVRERRIEELRAEMNEEADAAGDLLTERKQPLLIGSIRKKIPALYSQENEKDPMVWAKFFSPYMRMGYWLITEFDGDDTLFGLANIGQGWELGYSSLKELEGAKGPGGVQAVERDMHFKPKKLSAAKNEIAGSRGES